MSVSETQRKVNEAEDGRKKEPLLNNVYRFRRWMIPYRILLPFYYMLVWL